MRACHHQVLSDNSRETTEVGGSFKKKACVNHAYFQRILGRATNRIDKLMEKDIQADQILSCKDD